MTMHKLLTWHERRDTVGGVFVNSAPTQWDKDTLQNAIRIFAFAPQSISKEDALTLAGQLQRYGGEYYMGIAREVREYLYAHFDLVRSGETHI